jgi:hypothetical protein
MPQTGLNESLPGSELNTAFYIKTKAPLMPVTLYRNTKNSTLLATAPSKKTPYYITFLTMWLFSATFMYMISHSINFP